MNVDPKAPGDFISKVRWQLPARLAEVRGNTSPLPIASLGNIRAAGTIDTASGGRGAPSVKFLTVRAPRARGAATLNVGRSAQNRASWATYLPVECVAVMISLGWDRST